MKTADKTIHDFGEQWQAFQDNTGHYASQEIFQDILGPLLSLHEIKGKDVADIGSGTGRIVNMLAEAGARSIVAVEPSQCFPVLQKNTENHKDKITYLQIPADQLAMDEKLDFVFSFGVVHHIPDPDPCIKACHRALRPAGQIALWLYGYEGNQLYLFLFNALHQITKRLPHQMLVTVCRLMLIPTLLYGKLAQVLKLPMHDYFSKHFLLLDRKVQMVTLYDQLNPAYAKYYRKEEAVVLLTRNGFQSIQIYHRHGYSWTVVGTKP